MKINPVEYDVVDTVWASSSYELSTSSRWPHVLWSVHYRLRYRGIFNFAFIRVVPMAMEVGFANFRDEGVEVDVVVLGDWVVVINRWDPNKWKKCRRCVFKVFVGGKV